MKRLSLKVNILKNRISLLRRCRGVFLIASFFLFSFLASAQNQPKVKAKADTTKIRIGEQINYQITVDDADTGVIFPKLQLDSLGKVELVESLDIDTLKKRLIKKYILTSFDSGSYTIPKQAVYIWNQPYYTDSIHIDVATVAVDTLKQKMYPIKAIVNEPYTFEDFKSYLWWILGALLLLGIILYFVFRKKETQEEREARIPPYQLAVSRLHQLDEKQLWQKNKIKQYYVELTDIVRTYIEKELKIPALESTTDELLETLIDFNASSALDIPKETLEKLQKLLQESDLVKFAKFKPLSNEIELHRNDAAQVIDGIKTTIPEVEETDENQALLNERHQGEQQEVMVKKEVIKKKWNAKRLIIVSIIILALAGVTTVGYFLYNGYNFAKENIIGDSTQELVNTKWYKSTYGHPAITVETPKILKPQKFEVPEELNNVIDKITIFSYGSLLGSFHLNVATTSFTDLVQEFNIDTGVDGALQKIATSGIQLTKIEKFPITIGNIEGKKVIASYEFENPITKKKNTNILTMVFLGNVKGIRQVIIVHKAGDKNGEQIVERIINSIEIEDEALE